MGAGHCPWGGFLMICNVILASCPLGPATAHGVGILTEMHVIYIIMPIGPSAATGEVETHGRKARKYIRIGRTN